MQRAISKRHLFYQKTPARLQKDTRKFWESYQKRRIGFFFPRAYRHTCSGLSCSFFCWYGYFHIFMGLLWYLYGSFHIYMGLLTDVCIRTRLTCSSLSYFFLICLFSYWYTFLLTIIHTYACMCLFWRTHISNKIWYVKKIHVYDFENGSFHIFMGLLWYWYVYEFLFISMRVSNHICMGLFWSGSFLGLLWCLHDLLFKFMRVSFRICMGLFWYGSFHILMDLLWYLHDFLSIFMRVTFRISMGLFWHIYGSLAYARHSLAVASNTSNM